MKLVKKEKKFFGFAGSLGCQFFGPAFLGLALLGFSSCMNLSKDSSSGQKSYGFNQPGSAPGSHAKSRYPLHPTTDSHDSGEVISDSEMLEIPESVLKQMKDSSQLSDRSPQFDWPVESARMTRGFIPERRKRKRPHWGIDLAAPKGSSILTAHEGRVIYAGRSFKGYGKMVLLEADNGWATIYAHLDTIKVKQGEKLSQGTLVGGMGRTGRATGVHLHFEIRHLKRPIDPMDLLPGFRNHASRSMNFMNGESSLEKQNPLFLADLVKFFDLRKSSTGI